MRIAVINARAQDTRHQRRSAPDYALSLAKGMEAMGHTVEIIDAWTDDGMKLPGCDYIAIATEPLSIFSAKIPEAIPKLLSSRGIDGKKSAAFIKKTGLRSGKALFNLMTAMEKEGMIVNWSEILLSAPHAEAMGKRIGS
jgi:hypothetical protein